MSLFCPAAKEHLVQLYCLLMCVYIPAMNADGLLKASEGERYKRSSLRILHAARTFSERSRFFLTFRKPTLVWVSAMFALCGEGLKLVGGWVCGGLGGGA